MQLGGLSAVIPSISNLVLGPTVTLPAHTTQAADIIHTDQDSGRSKNFHSAPRAFTKIGAQNPERHIHLRPQHSANHHNMSDSDKEKHELAQPHDGSSVEVGEVSPEEQKREKSVLHKFDKWVMPQMAILVLFAYLDRTNIGMLQPSLPRAISSLPMPAG